MTSKMLAAIGLLLMGLGAVAACGVVGPPIPPEDVGLAAALEKGKQKERAKAAAVEAKPEGQAPPVEEGPDLLPLRPIGTP